MNVTILLQLGIEKFEQELEAGSESLTEELQKVWVALDDGASVESIDTAAVRSQVATLKGLLDDLERVFPASTLSHIEASTL